MKNKKINDFIKPAGGKKNNKNKNYKKVLYYVSGFLLLLVVFFGVLYFIYYDDVKNIYTYGLEGRDSFYEAQESLLDQDFNNAKLSLNTAVESFNTANNNYKNIAWMESIPILGKQFDALGKILLAGISTGDSLVSVVTLSDEVITPLQKDDEISLSTLSESETKSLLKNIHESKSGLEEAKVQIDKAVSYIDSINSKGLIGQIKEVVKPLQEQIPELQQGIDMAISASQILPSVGGYPEEKSFLFLLENNTELRPTGGFIGTYGILKIKNGDIKSFETDNVYNLDEPAKEFLFEDPPWPLTRYNAVYNWYLRDSNWSPDYPTAAQKAEYFYNAERGPEKKLDGVIAVTPTFIQSLLNLTGPITVSGLEFNSDNLVDTLQYQVDKGFLSQGLEESDRKEIIGDLSQHLLDGILELPRSKWKDFWEIFSQDIKEKQILIYSKDEYVQNYIEKENWGGKIYDTNSDYFAVIDANLASLKTDPYVKRTINYKVNRDGRNFVADLEIKYKNEANLTWKTTRYRSYTRVYVPSGANLLSSSGAMVDCKLAEEGDVAKEQELGKSVFGAFICIEPGEEKTLNFKYVLPNNIFDNFNDSKYSLMIQKQPGTQNHDLNIELDLRKKPKTVEVNGVVDNDMNSDIILNSVLLEDYLINVTF